MRRRRAWTGHRAPGVRGRAARVGSTVLVAVALVLPLAAVASASVREGPPLLRAASVNAGRPGQTITLFGSDFFSANGLVVASFGGHAAPTRCPTRLRCIVTIPTHARLFGGYPLRVRTETGVSNALSFTVR